LGSDSISITGIFAFKKGVVAPAAWNAMPRQSFTMRLQHPSKSILNLPSLRFGFAGARLYNPADNLLLASQPSPQAFEQLVQSRVKLAQSKPAKRAEVIASLTEVLDQFLQERVTPSLEDQKKTCVVEALKTLLGEQGQGNMVLAQINPVAGDVKGNSEQVKKYARLAEAIGADAVVFPELTLLGYPIRDVIQRTDLVKRNVQKLLELAKESKNTRLLVGFAEPRQAFPGEKRIGRSYYNSVAVLANGRIESITRKSLLPTYGEFNDWRQFEPAPFAGSIPLNRPVSDADLRDITPLLNDITAAEHQILQSPKPQGALVNLGGYQAGLSICEDNWNNQQFFQTPLYPADPVEQLAHTPGNAVQINVSASPSRANKDALKHDMFGFVSKAHQIPLVDVNQVGAIDEHSYNGASCMYDKQGQLVARAKSFESQFLVVNPLRGEGKIYNLPGQIRAPLPVEKKFSLHYSDAELARTYFSIVQGIRDYFRKTGHEKAVLGLSGGLDSSVVATLLVDALGEKNVIGLRLPAKVTSQASNDDAKKLASRLGIKVYTIPIMPVVEVVWKLLSRVKRFIDRSWSPTPPEKDTTYGNIQARVRAVFIWGIANLFRKAMPIATSDKTELYMGYATVNGDMSGGLTPVGDVTKTKLFALADWMNRNRSRKNAIPAAVLAKRPGAELEEAPNSAKTIAAEEDNMPYPFADEIIWRMENLGQSPDEMMQEPFEYENNQAISRETKQGWIDKFYRKMQAAVFKWWLIAPIIITDARDITKTAYGHPITARIYDPPSALGS
jgi:NAD+ synthase (glutamine-hydrolysing)